MNQRPVDDVAVADDPADVGAAPPDLAGLDAVEIEHRPFQRDQMPAIVAHDALGNSGGARGVENVERIGRQHRRARRSLAGIERGAAQRRPVVIAAGREFASLLRPLQDDAALRLDARKPDRLVEQRLVLHDAAGLDAAACRKDQFRFGVLDPGREFFRGEAAEHHRMHRADARAGQHREHRFRHQRHVEDDAVALGDAEIGHHGSERLHLLEHLGIGEFRDGVGERRIVDQRHLVGASARDMAVERVVAGVDHASGEPAAIRAHRGIEDLFGRLDPVDLARRLGPKSFGVGQRAGMDLVVPALLVDVHGALPAGSPFARHARPCAGHPRTCIGSTKARRGWPGTSPAMTAGQAFIPGIVTGSCARSSRNSFAPAAHGKIMLAALQTRHPAWPR